MVTAMALAVALAGCGGSSDVVGTVSRAGGAAPPTQEELDAFQRAVLESPYWMGVDVTPPRSLDELLAASVDYGASRAVVGRVVAVRAADPVPFEILPGPVQPEWARGTVETGVVLVVEGREVVAGSGAAPGDREVPRRLEVRIPLWTGGDLQTAYGDEVVARALRSAPVGAEVVVVVDESSRAAGRITGVLADGAVVPVLVALGVSRAGPAVSLDPVTEAVARAASIEGLAQRVRLALA
jgi:hypothetical protein